METIFNWISENKEWVFSGVGIASIGLAYQVLKKSMNSATTYLSEIAFNSTQIQKIFLEVDKLNLEFEKIKDISQRKKIQKNAKKFKRNLERAKKEQEEKLMFLSKHIGRLRGNMYMIDKMKKEYKEQELKDKANSFYNMADKEYKEMSEFYLVLTKELEETTLKIRHLESVITAIATDKIIKN